MKQTQLDKHTIAWFKIAECVSRGEKERALGVYRLLSYSFNDNAVARQLEADIYFSFSDKAHAIPLYYIAMELYQKSDRFLEAAAVGEHLIIMRPDEIALRRELIKLHMTLNNSVRMHHHVDKALDILFFINNEHSLQEFISVLHGYSDKLYEHAIAYLKIIK